VIQEFEEAGGPHLIAHPHVGYKNTVNGPFLAVSPSPAGFRAGA